METPVPEFLVLFPADPPDREVAPQTLVLVRRNIHRLGRIAALLEAPIGAEVPPVEVRLVEVRLGEARSDAVVRCRSDAVRIVDASVDTAEVHHRDADRVALRHAGVDRVAL